MNKLERENKRLRAMNSRLNTVNNRLHIAIENLKKTIESMRDLMISTVLDGNTQLEQENAELRKKAEAWDLFEKVMGVSEVIFFRTEEGWCIWSSGYIGFNYGPTPYDAFMVAYNALNKDEDGEE